MLPKGLRDDWNGIQLYHPNPDVDADSYLDLHTLYDLSRCVGSERRRFVACKRDQAPEHAERLHASRTWHVYVCAGRCRYEWFRTASLCTRLKAFGIDATVLDMDREELQVPHALLHRPPHCDCVPARRPLAKPPDQPTDPTDPLTDRRYSLLTLPADALTQ